MRILSNLIVSGTLDIDNVSNAGTDTNRFLVQEINGLVRYRTGDEVLADIAAQGSLTLTITGNSGASTLIGNTLNIPTYTLAGLGGVPASRTITINGTTFDLSANRTYSVGTVTSVGLSMPAAFSVANSPITGAGTLAVTAAGTSAQYIRGDGQLATLPSSAGGGSSVNYYLNGSINQGTIGGSVYYEMNRTPVIGAGTDFTRTNLQGDGLIAQFITDANDPNRLEIPAGAWNFEMYFNVSSAGGTPAFYLELLKYDGTTFTSIANGSTNPETITGGTAVDLYLSSLAVPQTTLLATDRLAIRVYVITSGRNITLHTEDNNLCEIITTFAGGVASLNGLTANTQYFATGTSGTDFAISSATDTHTFNLPTASATNRGALSSADWSTFSGKVGGSGTTGQVAYWNGTSSQTGSNNLFWDAANARLGIGTNTPARALDVRGAARIETASTTELDLIAGGGNIVRLASSATTPFIGTLTSAPFGFITAAVERARVSTNGNLLVGTTSDGGQRLQVQGTSFFSDSLGIGSTTLTGYGLRVSKTITGSIIAGGIYNDGQVQSDVTSSVRIYRSQLNIVNSVFTISDVYHYIAEQGTIGASSTVTNQYGYITGNLTKGTNNYGYYGTITAATNRWNLYMEGTADNYLAGKLLIGTTTVSTFALDVNGTARVSGAVTFAEDINLTRATSPAIVSTTNQNIRFVTNGFTTNMRNDGVFVSTTGFRTDGFVQTVNLAVGASFYNSTPPTNGAIIQGSVGIGTTSPSGKLHIRTDTDANVIFTGEFQYSLNNLGNAYANYTLSTLQSVFSTNGAERMRITSATGNLLVGTTTDAGERLQVFGEVAIKNNTNSILKVTTTAGTAQIQFTNTAGTQSIIGGLGGSNNMDFYTNSIFRMRIDPSGNLGLGVTPTAWASIFNVIEGPRGSVIAFQNNGNSLKLGSNFYFTGANYNYVNTNAAARYDADYEHRWYNAPSGTAGNAISFTQAMTLTGNGNLLVGTTTDNGSKLQVSGAATFSSSVTATEFIGIDNATLTALNYNTNGTVLTLNSKGTVGVIAFQTNTTERLRITSGGNLLVGTTTDAGEKLQVNGTSRFSSTLQITGNGTKINWFNSGFENWFAGTILNSTSFSISSATTSNILTLFTTGAATFSSSVTASSLIKSGGTSSQYLMADGSTSTLTNPVTGTGTTNYLPKWTSGSALGNSLVYDNGTNVGIGTTSPAYKLDVNGEINAVTRYRVNAGIKTNQLFGDGAAFSTSNTNDLGIRNDSGNILFASGGATVQLLLNTSGNLGLGVVPSAWTSLVPAFQINNAAIAGNNNADLYITANAYYNSGWKYIQTTTANLYQMEDGIHSWHNAPSGITGNAISFTQAMTLNASGNLSIGNTNDTYKLDVNGTGMFSSTVNIVANASAQNLVIQGRSSDNYGQILFYSNNTATRYGYLQSGSPYGGTVALVGDGGARIDLDNRGLNVTGAATFSSSVTASSFIKSGGTSSQYLMADGSTSTLTNPVTGSGTTNYLPKWTSGSALGNSILEDIGGNIVKLGNTSISNAALITFQNSVNGFQFGFNSTTTQRFVWNNGAPTEIMCLTGTGNLGLGVVPSAWSSYGSAIMQLPNAGTIVSSNQFAYYGANWYYDGSFRYIVSAQASYYGQVSGEHRFYSAASGTAGNAITFTQAMTLNSGGRLLLGTTTDDGSNRLQVNGGIITNVSTGFTALVTLKSGNGESYISETDGNLNMVFVNKSTIDLGANISDIRFCTNNNTTTPALILAISGAATFSSTVTATTFYTPNGGDFGWGDGSTFIDGDSSNQFIRFIINSSERARFNPSGNLLVGTTADNGSRLQVSGAATFSSSVTAGGSIASGLGLIVANATNARRFELGYSTGAGYNFFQVYDGAAFQPMMINNLLYLNGSSNVGIGTPSPARALHVLSGVGTAQIQSSGTTSHMYFGDVNSSVIDNQGIGSVGNNLWFSAGGLERLRITSGGNLLLGSTSDTGEKFQVTGAGIVSGLFTVSGSTGIPATTAANLRFASGFSSPDIGRMYIGDGSGWKFHMSKRLSSTTTDLITFFDNGSVQTTAPTGYTAQPWKLGDVFTGTITPDRHIMVEINGNIYTIPALLGTP